MKHCLFFFLSTVLSVVSNVIGQDEPPPGFTPTVATPQDIAYAPPGAPIDRSFDKSCGYNSLGNLLQNEGTKIGNTNGYNIGLEECKQKCSDTYDCKSITWCEIGFTKCHMKGKIVNVNRNEPTKNDQFCKTYYPKTCNGNGCKCGTSCTMSNGRTGTCQEDNRTCAQNIIQPYCQDERYRCQGNGDPCGIGNGGYDHGECCFEYSCLPPSFIGPGAGTVYQCGRCQDDPNWTDYNYGDKNNLSKCINLTLDYCNNVEAYGENYTEEARRFCPKSCGLC